MTTVVLVHDHAVLRATACAFCRAPRLSKHLSHTGQVPGGGSARRGAPGKRKRIGGPKTSRLPGFIATRRPLRAVPSGLSGNPDRKCLANPTAEPWPFEESIRSRGRCSIGLSTRVHVFTSGGLRMADLRHRDTSVESLHAPPPVPDKARRTRRGFLTLGAGTAIATTVLAAHPSIIRPAGIESRSPESRSRGYQETAHARSYYATTRV